MTNRFNIVDIVVGVGMSAIMFGAVLLFMVGAGTLEGAPMALVPAPQPFKVPGDRVALQPMIGQTVVEQARREYGRDQALTHASHEFVRATLAQHELASLPGGPLGAVMREAGAMAINHAARVQEVMGRAIVNFTGRGVRTGAIVQAGDQGMFNARMISATEDMGHRLDDEFAATWQAMLGQRIVQAIQDYTARAEMIQERLGSALVGMAAAENSWEDARSANQYRLASLTLAAQRSDLTAVPSGKPSSIVPVREEIQVASRTPSSSGIPIGLLVVALVILGSIYLAGLIVAAHAREAKALAQSQRDAARWAYRLAT